MTCDIEMWNAFCTPPWEHRKMLPFQAQTAFFWEHFELACCFSSACLTDPEKSVRITEWAALIDVI